MASVTRRAKGDRAARRDEMTGRLLEAVEELLADGQTFTEISVEQLIQRAGMSRSTFYYYYEDKGDLLRALTADVLTELGDAARAWWQTPPAAAREQLRASVGEVVAVYRPHARLVAAMVETAEHDPAVREVYARLVGSYIAETTDLIERGQAAGVVRAGLPPAETAAVLSWMLERACHQLVRDADPAAAARIADAIAAVMGNTLYEEPTDR